MHHQIINARLSLWIGPFLVASFLALPASGQSAIHRAVSFVTLRYATAQHIGALRVSPEDGVPLELDWTLIGRAVNVTAPAPFQYVMGGEWLGGTDFLLAGVSGFPAAPVSRLSLIRLVTAPADAITEPSHSTLTGIDTRAVCWDPAVGVLFIADGVTSSVMAAPWTLGTALPPKEQFVALFGAADVPLLQSDRSLAIEPTPMGVLVYDADTQVGKDCVFTGGAWQFMDWDLRNSIQQNRWSLADPMEAPTQGSLEITLAGGGGTSEPFSIVSLEDGFEVASGTHPGTGIASVPVPSVFHVLPGRTFLLSGGARRSEFLTPIVKYGATQGSPLASLRQDLAFRPTMLQVNTPHLFGVTMQVKRPGNLSAAYTVTAHLLLGIRTGPNDPVVTQGPYDLLDGAVLESFPVTFDAGVELVNVRRHIAIPDDDGFANLVVFFQFIMDDGSGGWVVSSIKGSAIRPRANPAAASLRQGMTAQQYLQQCRSLAQQADRQKARAWVLRQNPNAITQRQALFQAIGR
jgi:hypothetical protein